MITAVVRTGSGPAVDPLEAGPAPSATTTLASIAVDLGWTVDELWRITEGDEPSDDLPGLPIDRRVQVHCRQIESAVAHFGLERDTDLLADLSRVRAQLTTAQDPDAEAAVEKLHLTLLADLTAAHHTLGKAYLLGSGLASLYRDGPGWIAVSRDNCIHAHDRFDPCTISAMLDALAELHGVLPRNAAGTVSLSLELTFADDVSRPRRGADRLDPAGLRLQGHRWRAMLTGGTEVDDLLESADYLQAGMSLTGDLRVLLDHAVRQFWLPLTVVGALGAAGMLLSFLSPVVPWAGGGIVGASLSFVVAFLAAVRIIGPTVIRVAETTAPRVWDQAVMRTVAEALPRSSYPRHPVGAPGPSSQVPRPRRPLR